MENLRPNEKRAKNAIILIWIVLIAHTILAISSYFEYDLLQDFVDGAKVSTETAKANDMRQMILGVIFLVVWVISGVTFIQWFRRAYYNLSLKVQHLSNSDGWAAGSWFVPLINFYLPYQMMRELYHETKVLLIDKGVTLTEELSTKFVGWWWALFIVSSIFGQVMFQYSRHAETIDDLITISILQMITFVFKIPWAIITVKVIKDYSKIETLMLEIKDEEEALISE